MSDSRQNEHRQPAVGDAVEVKRQARVNVDGVDPHMEWVEGKLRSVDDRSVVVQLSDGERLTIPRHSLNWKLQD